MTSALLGLGEIAAESGTSLLPVTVECFGAAFTLGLGEIESVSIDLLGSVTCSYVQALVDAGEYVFFLDEIGYSF